MCCVYSKREALPARRAGPAAVAAGWAVCAAGLRVCVCGHGRGRVSERERRADGHRPRVLAAVGAGIALTVVAEAGQRDHDGAHRVARAAHEVEEPVQGEHKDVVGVAAETHADAEEGDAEARQGHEARREPARGQTQQTRDEEAGMQPVAVGQSACEFASPRRHTICVHPATQPPHPHPAHLHTDTPHPAQRAAAAAAGGGRGTCTAQPVFLRGQRPTACPRRRRGPRPAPPG